MGMHGVHGTAGASTANEILFKASDAQLKDVKKLTQAQIGAKVGEQKTAIQQYMVNTNSIDTRV